MGSRIDGNFIFRGIIQFLNIILPNGCVADKHIGVAAAVQASKLQHQHRSGYAQESATTAAAETRIVHVVHGTSGLAKAVKAGCVVPCVGDATITVDLLKNGVSILTAAISLTSAQAAYALVDGVIDTDTLAAGDVLEMAVAVAPGTGTLGEGVFAYVDNFEDAA